MVTTSLLAAVMIATAGNTEGAAADDPSLGTVCGVALPAPAKLS